METETTNITAAQPAQQTPPADPEGGRRVPPAAADGGPAGAAGAVRRMIVRRRAKACVAITSQPVIPDAPVKPAPLESLPGGLGSLGKGLAARRRVHAGVQSDPVRVLPRERSTSLIDIDLLTPEEVAQALRLEGRPNYRNTLRHLHRTGRLRGVKVAGRIQYPRKAVEDYIGYCMARAGK